jgi:hypothetical protein
VLLLDFQQLFFFILKELIDISLLFIYDILNLFRIWISS